MNIYGVLLLIAQDLGGTVSRGSEGLFIVTFTKDVSVNIEAIFTPAGRIVFACYSIVGLVRPNLEFERLLLANQSEDEDLDLSWCYFSVSKEEGGNLLMLTYTFTTPSDDIDLVNDSLRATVMNMRDCNIASRRTLAGVWPFRG